MRHSAPRPIPDRHLFEGEGFCGHTHGGRHPVRRDGRLAGSKTQFPTTSGVASGCCAVRKDMELFANLRPVRAIRRWRRPRRCARRSRAGRSRGGAPNSSAAFISASRAGSNASPMVRARAVNTQVYTTPEVRRIGQVAFGLARTRNRRVTSVDKANVMESGVLWREEMEALRAERYADVALITFMSTTAPCSSCARPSSSTSWSPTHLRRYLSDCASMITARSHAPFRLNERARPRWAPPAFYEPVHGAPRTSPARQGQPAWRHLELWYGAGTLIRPTRRCATAGSRRGTGALNKTHARSRRTGVQTVSTVGMGRWGPRRARAIDGVNRSPKGSRQDDDDHEK